MKRGCQVRDKAGTAGERERQKGVVSRAAREKEIERDPNNKNKREREREEEEASSLRRRLPQSCRAPPRESRLCEATERLKVAALDDSAAYAKPATHSPGCCPNACLCELVWVPIKDPPNPHTVWWHASKKKLSTLSHTSAQPPCHPSLPCIVPFPRECALPCVSAAIFAPFARAAASTFQPPLCHHDVCPALILHLLPFAVPCVDASVGEGLVQDHGAGLVRGLYGPDHNEACHA